MKFVYDPEPIWTCSKCGWKCNNSQHMAKAESQHSDRRCAGTGLVSGQQHHEAARKDQCWTPYEDGDEE